MVAANDLVEALKAAAEPTRLRLLALLETGELTVKDMTRIMGQSQPRLSRHLKLLAEAGLVERAPEGSWVYFRLPSPSGQLVHTLLAMLDRADPMLLRDRQRRDEIIAERQAEAQAYFARQAADWDRLRALHVAEADVETAMRDVLGVRKGSGKVDLLVDVGTGTGRILELFADSYHRGLGFDLNTSMLAYARQRLEAKRLAWAQVRQGDIYDLPVPDGAAGIVILHQVLHYLTEPARAVREAARLVAPGGKLLIVDFAPHALEFLRDEHRHERLGFETAQVEQWLADAGLSVRRTHALAPEGDTAKLTVSLWLAESGTVARAAARRGAKPPSSTFERTA